jgi:SAM-dependent methyltransferase
VCGKCNSKQRHRLFGLWIDANHTIDGARILHFAPEPILARILRDRAAQYKSADLDPTVGETVLNIENIDLPDESVDVVMCSHVLEHVDDAKALREIHRVLAPGGRALLMFPVVEGWEHTYENPDHTSPRDRARYFGQSDHVRYFGRDVRDRIGRAGFALSEFTADEPNVARYGLDRGEKLFIATKPK